MDLPCKLKKQYHAVFINIFVGYSLCPFAAVSYVEFGADKKAGSHIGEPAADTCPEGKAAHVRI